LQDINANGQWSPKNQFDMEKYMADEQLKADRVQPSFDDIRMRSSAGSAGAQEADSANDERGREKLRY